jgi:DNA polymerase elongation subunit (family B)
LSLKELQYWSSEVYSLFSTTAKNILLKTKDIVQSAGFELIYADTDAVFLKKKDAIRKDYEEIMSQPFRDWPSNDFRVSL